MSTFQSAFSKSNFHAWVSGARRRRRKKLLQRLAPHDITSLSRGTHSLILCASDARNRAEWLDRARQEGHTVEEGLEDGGVKITFRGGKSGERFISEMMGWGVCDDTEEDAAREVMPEEESPNQLLAWKRKHKKWNWMTDVLAKEEEQAREGITAKDAT